MTIFDIMGPIMVGPSSSHTAGAVRIGLLARHLLGVQPLAADILLHGSFAATGAGHGTDRAIVAGLLGMQPDHPDIPRSFQLAKEAGMDVYIHSGELRNAHPNTAYLVLTHPSGRTTTLSASSLGGGRVQVNAIDGLAATFNGELPTLVVRNVDRPGMLFEVSAALYQHGANIASMQLHRDRRGGLAVMVIECDQPLSEELQRDIANLDGVARCTYLNMNEEA